jgi:peptidoglycan hydrolase-like protein with peptidoglycan-binding domain
MKGVNSMNKLIRRRLTGIGLSAAVAAAAVAVAGMTAGTASAAPAAPARAAARTAVAAPATTATWKPPKRTLVEGMRGADVKSVQERLSSLKYYAGPSDGKFGNDTLEAVWAFQEVNGIPTTGNVDAATKKALVHPKTYKAKYPGQDKTRIEVNLHIEVLVYYEKGKIALISHISSGGGYYYDGGARAVTPEGKFYTDDFMPGWIAVPLGYMYNPIFFIGTAYAIHGDIPVPLAPVSHGCVRIPMDIAGFFHNMVKTPGTEVLIYGTPQWAS